MGDWRQREQPLVAVSLRLPGDRRCAAPSRQTVRFRQPLPPDEPQSAQTKAAFTVLEWGWGQDNRRPKLGSQHQTPNICVLLKKQKAPYINTCKLHIWSQQIIYAMLFPLTPAWTSDLLAFPHVQLHITTFLSPYKLPLSSPSA